MKKFVVELTEEELEIIVRSLKLLSEFITPFSSVGTASVLKTKTNLLINDLSHGKIKD